MFNILFCKTFFIFFFEVEMQDTYLMQGGQSSPLTETQPCSEASTLEPCCGKKEKKWGKSAEERQSSNAHMVCMHFKKRFNRFLYFGEPGGPLQGLKCSDVYIKGPFQREIFFVWECKNNYKKVVMTAAF